MFRSKERIRENEFSLHICFKWNQSTPFLYANLFKGIIKSEKDKQKLCILFIYNIDYIGQTKHILRASADASLLKVIKSILRVKIFLFHTH